ncbi:MAG: GNAT family N-acetyltransferase, partial [Chloroflexota bacterium]
PGDIEWRRGAYLVSTDARRLDYALTARVLAETYWATGIPERVVRQSVAGSLAFGLYELAPSEVGVATAPASQIGFARVVTDRAVFAWVGDVFVAESHQGRGLGLWLMQCVMAHPDLQGMRRWMLASTTARGLYAKLGFSQLSKPELFMEIYDPEIHRRPA